MKKISDLIFRRRQEHIRREIYALLAKGQKTSVLDEASRKMIENILEFTSMSVREIMIPRTEIVSINVDDAAHEIIRKIAASHFTRLPVHRGAIDNIIGILNVKDLLEIWSQNMTTADILSRLTKPYYIPETKNAHLLFHEFKDNKQHIAIVIDEYGGTSGLVTLEDLLEEIVGDIRDEHEDNSDSEDIIQTADGAIIVDGRTEIEKIEEHLHIDIEKGRYETVSGLILNTIRRIPHRGEKFHINGMEMTIENADDRSIRKVKINKMDDQIIDEE
ncbi:MAG: HlyC/CorC family transporter [Deltaproteobacteria bacterium]|nr:HlyC/CorC family transporter [Deltaproteobacteria bacterium]